MTLGGLYPAPAMEHFETLLFTACLTLFTSWLSYLSYRLKISMDEIEHSSKGMDDLHEALDLCQKALGAIWENMPTMERIQELVPQFHINQQETNGKHLFDLIGNLFIFAVSFTWISISAFVLFIVGDVSLERAGIGEKTRYLLTITVILLLVALIK